MKNILVIGASGEIGRAISCLLAEEGHQLILHYHKNKQALTALKHKIPQEQLLSEIQADLTTQSGIEVCLEQIVFPVDAVIFASGMAHFGLFQDASFKDMEKMLTLHVKAPWMIAQRLLPQMINKQSGTIVLVTSIWGERGASHEVMYSTVKGAENSFVKALAKEVAPSGVMVNAVSPGLIDTKMNQHLTPEEREAVIEEIPANRAGKPIEVARVVAFLLQNNTTYIQGAVIDINGGWM